LRRLVDEGYVLAAISTQSCVGYGYATHCVVDAVFDKLARDLWADAEVCWSAFAYSVGAGSRGAICVGGGHWAPISDDRARHAARVFLATGARPTGMACAATLAPNSSHGTVLLVTP
jgi:hypothetical protein